MARVFQPFFQPLGSPWLSLTEWHGIEFAGQTGQVGADQAAAQTAPASGKYPMATSTMFVKGVFDPLHPFEMHDQGGLAGRLLRLCRMGKKSIDQGARRRLREGEIRHEENRLAYGLQDFLRPGSGQQPIKITGQRVPLVAAAMTAATTGLLQKFDPAPRHRAFGNGEPGKAAGDQVMMCQLLTIRSRVAPMAMCATAGLGIVGGVAFQAASLRCRKHRQKQKKNDQKGTTSDQFSPRKNMATTVSATMPTKTMRVSQLTSR